jgi:hypothetical protein
VDRLCQQRARAKDISAVVYHKRHALVISGYPADQGLGLTIRLSVFLTMDPQPVVSVPELTYGNLEGEMVEQVVVVVVRLHVLLEPASPRAGARELEEPKD